METFKIKVTNIKRYENYSIIDIEYINGWDFLAKHKDVFVHNSIDLENQRHLNIIAAKAQKGNRFLSEFIIDDKSKQVTGIAKRYNISVPIEYQEKEKQLTNIRRSKIYQIGLDYILENNIEY